MIHARIDRNPRNERTDIRVSVVVNVRAIVTGRAVVESLG